MTAAELARGRALRDAERDEPYQGRVTHAFSDWLDQHCDDLLEAAAQVAEKDAQIAALQTEIADLRVVIDVLDEYLRETPAPPQTQEPQT